MLETDAVFAGPYIIGRALGQTSYGRLKLGTHRTTGQKVAIKILRCKDIVRSPETMKRMQREITVLRLISHPNVQRLLDVIQTSSHVFLILEHIPGGELLDLLRKGRLSLDAAFRYFYTLLLAVEYCHACCICHRNIKLENILIDVDGNVKLGDFGMSALMDDEQLLRTNCGSPHYASPEVIQGFKYDGIKCDIWSLGVVFYGLCAGQLPFDDTNIQHVLRKACEADYHTPPYFTPHLSDFISSMLTVDTEARASMVTLKAHPFWVSMCEKLGLDPVGHTSPTMPPPKPPPVQMQKIEKDAPPELGYTAPIWISRNLPSDFSSDPSKGALRSAAGSSGLADSEFQSSHTTPTSSPLTNVSPSSADSAFSSSVRSPHDRRESTERNPAEIIGSLRRRAHAIPDLYTVDECLDRLDDVNDPVELRMRVRRLADLMMQARAIAADFEVAIRIRDRQMTELGVQLDRTRTELQKARQELSPKGRTTNHNGPCAPTPAAPPATVPCHDLQAPISVDVPAPITELFRSWGWKETDLKPALNTSAPTVEKALYHLLVSHHQQTGQYPTFHGLNVEKLRTLRYYPVPLTKTHTSPNFESVARMAGPSGVFESTADWVKNQLGSNPKPPVGSLSRRQLSDNSLDHKKFAFTPPLAPTLRANLPKPDPSKPLPPAEAKEKRSIWQRLWHRTPAPTTTAASASSSAPNLPIPHLMSAHTTTTTTQITTATTTVAPRPPYPSPVSSSPPPPGGPGTAATAHPNGCIATSSASASPPPPPTAAVIVHTGAQGGGCGGGLNGPAQIGCSQPSPGISDVMDGQRE